jgi:hypothetical protein
MKLKMLMPIAALAALVACGPSSYRATNSNLVVVPDNTRNAFTVQYPGATNVVWSSYDASVAPIVDWDLSGWPALDNSDYVVQFDVDNQPYYAWYDEDGNWIGSAYVMSTSTLPASIQSTLNTQFGGYSVVSLNREMAKGRDAYQIELKGNNNKVKLLVDSNGNILKQKTKAL